MHADPPPTAPAALASENPASADRREVTAVILAAGRGTRLGAPCKPLAMVGGLTLLDRAVITARTAGIRRIVVVVPSLDGDVAAFCRGNLAGVEVAAAPDCLRGNGATVAAGLIHAGGRCLVMMVDHLHEPATVERLLQAEGDFVFAVDSQPRHVDVAEATLVRRAAGTVVAIDKQLPGADAAEARLAVCTAEPLRNRRGHCSAVGSALSCTSRMARTRVRGSPFLVAPSVTWRFDDPLPHNVMFAEGPRPVDSPTRRHGTWSKRFTVPGLYRLFCTYHRSTRDQTVSVRRSLGARGR
jgi:CTP:molybdopterin cytidylyltransferase MocA